MEKIDQMMRHLRYKHYHYWHYNHDDPEVILKQVEPVLKKLLEFILAGFDFIVD